ASTSPRCSPPGWTRSPPTSSAGRTGRWPGSHKPTAGTTRSGSPGSCWSTVSVTGRLAEPDWIPIACLAEQLALYLVVEEAASLLDRYGLDDDPRARYQFFEEQAFENDAHLRLYSEPGPGTGANPAAGPINAWFTPFYDGFYVHPYVEPRL